MSKAKKLMSTYDVNSWSKKAIGGQLQTASSYIEAGTTAESKGNYAEARKNYSLAQKTLNSRVPGHSKSLEGMMIEVEENSIPKNFPNRWHSSQVRNKVAGMNKELVFAGNRGDCFYGSVAKQLGIPMQQVRNDLHQQALDTYKNYDGKRPVTSDGIPMNLFLDKGELKQYINSGALKTKGIGGDYRFGQFVADKYERPVTMIDKEGNTQTFKPQKDSGKPAIVIAYNGGHFDAVMDKQPKVQQQSFGYNDWQPQQNYGQYNNQNQYSNGMQQNFGGLSKEQVDLLNTYY